MSVLLYVIGGVAIMLGVAMVGYGIPINEFSFGNTLITAGTTAVVGGLIVFAIGAAVAQLQRLSEALTTRNLVRPARPLRTFEPAAAAPQGGPAGRASFPPRPPAEAPVREPHPFDPRMAAPSDMPHDDRFAAPALRNPDMPSLDEDVSLLPGHANQSEPMRSAPQMRTNGAGMAERRHDAAVEAEWRSPPPPRRGQQQNNKFDTAWPSEPRPAEPKPAMNLPSVEGRAGPRSDLAPPSPAAPSRAAGEPRSASILKSGIVDGMAYTLFVDGSIEAELPQGTLRFASINELRNHLSKSP